MTTKHNLVILDTPSLLLATTSPPISSQHLSSFLLTLSAHPAVHSLVLSLPADEPFLAPAASAALAHLHDHSPGKSMSGGGGYESLEKENASFVVSATHMARTVMSCRPLGTGWAEDVSGVVRVTRGGAADDEEGDGDGAADREVDAVKEGEWLYFVGGDGAVDVWGRGEGAS
jgi:elongator complex protein 6